MDFEVVVVKCCVCVTFKTDACYSARFEGDLCFLPFQNLMLKVQHYALGKTVCLSSIHIEPEQLNKHS